MMLIAEIEVDTVTYHCARKPYQGLHYYYPFIHSLPSLEIGTVNGALIGIKLGNLVLTREPWNPAHPFGLTRFDELMSNPTQYLCTLYWGEGGSKIHDAAISLTSIDNDTLTFALTNPVYDQELKFYSQTAEWNYVSELTDRDGILEVTVPGNELIVGTIITFENMLTVGNEINYSRDDHNYYVVHTANGDVITLEDKNTNLVTITGITLGSVPYAVNQNRCGVPAFVPFAHGHVLHQQPVIQKANAEIANPNLTWLDPDVPIEVWEDGTLIGSTSQSSSEYMTQSPNNTTIFLNSPTTGGELSISGKAITGTTLDELFSYFASRLQLGYDGTKI